MANKKQQEASEINIVAITQGKIEFCILGRTPLYCERMSEKVKQGLILPPGKKNAAEKAASLKHNPLEEFRDSPYVSREKGEPTRILMPATAFKRALSDAAKDIPGAAKAQIGRLTWVCGTYVAIYGIPQISLAVVRCADISRTPDVRSRAVLPEWACHLTIEFVKPLLREQTVVNLLAAAGIMRGIGGWRVEKGAGNNGQFLLVDEANPDFLRIIKTGGREAQDKALAQPMPVDLETESLLAWYAAETARRGFKVA